LTTVTLKQVQSGKSVDERAAGREVAEKNLFR
jgi:hypothetical protein